MKNPFFQEMSPGLRSLLFGALILVCATVGAGAAVLLAIGNGISLGEIEELVATPKPEHIELLKWMNNLSQVSTLSFAFFHFPCHFLCCNCFSCEHDTIFLSGLIVDIVVCDIRWNNRFDGTYQPSFYP